MNFYFLLEDNLAAEEHADFSQAASEESVDNIPPQRKAVLQDPDYLQRILTPAFLSRPPNQHILVPQGPAGEEMEARLHQSATRRRQTVSEEDENRTAQLLQSFGRTAGTQARAADSQPRGVPVLEDGFEPTQDFSHLPGHSFSHQNPDLEDFDNQPLFQFPQPLQQSGLNPVEAPDKANVSIQGLSGHLVPPPPRPAEEELQEETVDFSETGPGVTSQKEDIKLPSEDLQVDPVKNEISPPEEGPKKKDPSTRERRPVLPFASYPGNPSQDWGQEYTDLKFPPFDNSRRQINGQTKQEINKAAEPRPTRPSNVLIRASSNVSKNNQVQRNS